MNEEIKKVYLDAVAEQAAKTGHLSWGGDESTAVIEKVADAAYSIDEGFDAIRGMVAVLVNPSAFKQRLEKLDASNPRHIVPSGKKRGGSPAGVPEL